MDRTIIDIITMTVGASGAFLYLSRYSPKELSGMFWDSNPYATKAQIINGSLTALYAVLGLLAFLLQIGRFIIQDQIPERTYGTQFYFVVALVAVLVMASLTHITKRLSRHRWFPEMVKGHRGLYEFVDEVVRNGGWTNAQLPHKDERGGNTLAEKNLEQADHRLKQIETLLEITFIPGSTLQERLERVRPHFEVKPSQQSVPETR